MIARHDEIQRRWANWLLERNRRGTSVVLWIVLGLYPAFGILDYLLAPPEALPTLWTTRIVVTLITCAMFSKEEGVLLPVILAAWLLIDARIRRNWMTFRAMLPAVMICRFANAKFAAAAIARKYCWPSGDRNGTQASSRSGISIRYRAMLPTMTRRESVAI